MVKSDTLEAIINRGSQNTESMNILASYDDCVANSCIAHSACFIKYRHIYFTMIYFAVLKHSDLARRTYITLYLQCFIL